MFKKFNILQISYVQRICEHIHLLSSVNGTVFEAVKLFIFLKNCYLFDLLRVSL